MEGNKLFLCTFIWLEIVDGLNVFVKVEPSLIHHRTQGTLPTGDHILFFNITFVINAAITIAATVFDHFDF